MNIECDILITGGGMTGAALALAVRHLPLRVAVLEARPATGGHAGDDDRSLTLSPSSKRLFEAVGLWPALAARGPAIIREIHVSDSGPLSGTVHLAARDLGVEALGYVVGNRAFAGALGEAMARHEGLTWLAPAELEGYDDCGTHLAVRATHEGQPVRIRCRLLVGADGTNSRVRLLAGIDARENDYRQTALVARFTPELPAPGVAFERFTPSGPLAVLPRSGGECGLVLCVPGRDAERLTAGGPEAACALAEATFGARLGRFQAMTVPSAFPLRRVMAASLVGSRVALVGNAAHTLHPVAAQGLNLGLRDVAALAELLEEHPRDPGASSLLQDYARRRRQDVWATSTFTNSLVRLFSNRIPGLGVARRAGLALTDALPTIKASLALRSMGLAGRLPPLLREASR
ncbi:MAG: FAD-dependent monooxygenase [Acidiferrobacteraceae bacterium]